MRISMATSESLPDHDLETDLPEPTELRPADRVFGPGHRDAFDELLIRAVTADDNVGECRASHVFEARRTPGVVETIGIRGYPGQLGSYMLELEVEHLETGICEVAVPVGHECDDHLTSSHPDAVMSLHAYTADQDTHMIREESGRPDEEVVSVYDGLVRDIFDRTMTLLDVPEDGSKAGMIRNQSFTVEECVSGTMVFRFKELPSSRLRQLGRRVEEGPLTEQLRNVCPY
ncbi:hypothetical protein RYH80_18270 [Halobaculum sp. MBLA0147]|uniref:hypothetical protein n=1 Tax=Halobaculum sp. MBLA0147 TaxID=3079934 RepID=UPI0035257DDC